MYAMCVGQEPAGIIPSCLEHIEVFYVGEPIRLNATHLLSLGNGESPHLLDPAPTVTTTPQGLILATSQEPPAPNLELPLADESN